ncbi:MAG: Asp-tRNA(Asn)/Glu-tRNA(Gln) amidotransferase subunit GatC [Endomicrobium sp.]|jgi:aspartyl/glutamyl-tRNA(Asn/Gln) amidotransferase C subunit|nr:Asp-tRNA(Asn)/Glu-tRNA(Gln) amidotransferase subunit GatC [Endomicrobium sp.]
MTKKELKIVSNLARIHIENNEKTKYLNDINEMIGCVKILYEQKFVNVKPTTHITNVRNIWRNDVVIKSSQKQIDKILNNAKSKYKTFYKINKVIDKE